MEDEKFAPKLLNKDQSPVLKVGGRKENQFRLIQIDPGEDLDRDQETDTAAGAIIDHTIGHIDPGADLEIDRTIDRADTVLRQDVEEVEIVVGVENEAIEVEDNNTKS